MAELFDPITHYRKQIERDIAAWEVKLEEIKSDESFVEPYKTLAISHLQDRIARMKAFIKS